MSTIINLLRAVADGDACAVEVARDALLERGYSFHRASAVLGAIQRRARGAAPRLPRQWQAEDLWDSPYSCLTIRVSLRGYQVWRGIGGMLVHVGHAPTYEDAEQLGVDAMYAARAALRPRILEILGPTATEDTPYRSCTVGTIEDMPIMIHRGPLHGGVAQGLRAGSGGRGPMHATSWDLPVVARVLRGGRVVRLVDELRLPWDDEKSREVQRARMRAGEERAAHRHAGAAAC